MIVLFQFLALLLLIAGAIIGWQALAYLAKVIGNIHVPAKWSNWMFKPEDQWEAEIDKDNDDWNTR